MTNIEAQLAEDYALHTSQSFFLTGKAGTGKTTLLKKIIKESTKNIAVVAPTGVAAINAGGSTIHSMFGFPLKIFVPSFDRVDVNIATNRALLKNHLRYRTEKRKIIQELELLIIDEISMVRADTLDAIDYALKYTRKNQLPFGGVQLIVIGDLFQLSPIAKENEWNYLRKFYRSPYFYNAQSWKEVQPLFIELKKVYRQEEENFIHILNSIRNGNPDAYALETLNDRYDPDFTTINNESIILTTHNYKADDINLKSLNNLKTKEYKFKADVSGNFSENSFPADEVLTLKQGAQIMFLRNDTDEGAYFNGKLATIEKINRDDIKVKFMGEDRSYYLKKEKWENKVYTIDKETNEISQEVKGAFEQYPVRLAWAITIHKSQGLTFEKAVIDVADAFAMGQTYVALSRCTNLEGMKLKSKVNPKSVMVNSEVQAFYKSAPPIKIMQEGLVISKNLYSRRKLRNTFNLDYLLDDFADWKVELEKKNIPEKAKALDLAITINQTLKNLANVSSTFKLQLDQLFAAYSENRVELPIRDRTEKAIGFFTKELFEKIITRVHKHIGEFSVKKSVKAYLKSTEELQKSFFGRLNALYKADFLGENIWKGEVMTIENLPKLSAKIESAKAAKGDTFLITLNLFKDGKTLKQIADIRAMAITTIEGHLAKWIGKGKVKISELMDMERVKKIVPYHDKIEDKKLTSFRNAIPFDTSFTELKYVQAYCQLKSAKKTKKELQE